MHPRACVNLVSKAVFVFVFVFKYRGLDIVSMPCERVEGSNIWHFGGGGGGGGKRISLSPKSKSQIPLKNF